MKISKVTIFIFSIIALLAVLSFVFPEEGLQLGSLHLKYANPGSFMQNDADNDAEVDQNLAYMNRELDISTLGSMYDTLQYYKHFVQSSPLRIHLPNNDHAFFDPVFQQFEEARKKKKLCRVLHYGDSQIEMDRISNILRQHLQQNFGGSGVGMVPAIQTVATYSLSQSYSGDLIRYIMFGDSTTRRASHRRYGPMAQFSTLSGQATLSFRHSGSRHAEPLSQQYQRISLLVNRTGGWKATVSADTIVRVDTIKQEQVSMISWTLKNKTGRARVSLNGNADIYGVLLDGSHGITVDNFPLRGSAGTLFTGIDQKLMQQTFSVLNPLLIILQFGGNAVPAISSQTRIDKYMLDIERQFEVLKKSAPGARFLFIGPSDMSKSYNGVMKTRKFLPELNEALKNTALKNNIAYWDMFQVMGGENSMAKWVKHNPPLAGSDHVHFTAAGAKEIGTLLSKSLLTNYQFYKIRQQVGTDLINKLLE
jgi:lysophospholipase L1-like esterase